MSEEGKLPTREEVISLSPESLSEALGMWSCQLCRLLCNNQAPKTKEEKSAIDTTHHAMGDLQHFRRVLFIHIQHLFNT